MDRGLFITVEGMDGSGGTTQATKIFNWMKERGIECELTKEPGTKHIRECVEIRKLVLDPSYNISARSELFLFLADRALHVDRFINEKLEQGIHVISDRFADSTRVYQCVRGLDRDMVDTLIDFATDGLVPDVTFLLDVPPYLGIERARKKSEYKGGDRMEIEDMSFHESVRNGFLKLASSVSDGYRFVTINTDKSSVEETHKKIIDVVSNKLWIG